MKLPERPEFGDEILIRLVRAAEEEAAREAARAEVPKRRWRVDCAFTGYGSVEVESETEEEARRLVESGEVDAEPDGWDDLEVMHVEPLDPRPEQASPPEQVVFPFLGEAGADAGAGC